MNNSSAPKKGGHPSYSGFIIIRLSGRYAWQAGDDLSEFCKKHKLEGLSNFLTETGKPEARRVVKSLSVKKLEELEKKAMDSKFRPLHSLTTYWRIDFRKDIEKTSSLLNQLNRLKEVDLAYKEMEATDPVVNRADDDFAADQDYEEAAPNGIDAVWAWTQPNGEGAGVGVIDLEQGWIPTHEDLTAQTPTLIHGDNRHGVGTYVGNHGTAVLGEIAGVDNTVGVVGIAPSLSYVKMASHYDNATGTTGHVADAITTAITQMNAGDVLLLEIQKSFLPTETDDADLDAIRLAVANGIVVVEAAGNGGFDLDAWTDGGGNTRLNRGTADFIDSGAIMVGASTSTVPHNRMNFSCFGSRIDCYAWGENVVTCGYGDLAGATDNDNYTDSFSGTSSASPIITGAAIIVQGMYKANNPGFVISPVQMRLILSDPTTGTAQGGGVAGNIGVMPNLRAIIEGDVLGLTADVYLRDFVGDTGAVPSAGAISASPDIIVRPSAVADPTASFGEGSGTENSASEGYTVEAGQNNFIYARMKNRGGGAASNVAATIYWSEVSTLVTPNLWNLIGTTAGVNVPVGDTLVVSNPLTWNSADIPATGHYCFVGILHSPQDPAPPVPAPAGFDWDDFRAFIKNHNNVTWRNFNVEEMLPDPSADPSALHFNIVGSPDKSRVFDIEILRQLPEDVKVWLEVPYNLYAFIRKNNPDLPVKYDRKKGKVLLELTRQRLIRFSGVLLNRKLIYKCRFIVKPSKSLAKGTYHLAIRQIFEKEEVGRVTWAIKAKTEKDKKKAK
jgi:serine protease